MQVNNHAHSNIDSYSSQKKIFKFLSTISSLDIIQKLSQENQLNSGMKQKLAELKLDFSIDTYKNLVYPRLGITAYTDPADIIKKQAITLEYAKILKAYAPSDSGELNASFKYAELVSVIKKIFKKHMTDPRKLLYNGVAIAVHENTYLAKVNSGRICIITSLGKPLGKGVTGKVASVFEMVSKQFIALKYARELTPESFQDIQIEVANLKKIQRLLRLRSLDPEGFQGPILADFNLPETKLVGYLGPQYDIDLADWIDQYKSSLFEKIKLCKSLMQIYDRIHKLNIWHGDIKVENIMLKNNQPVVIDWAGALMIEEAAENFITPKFKTSNYCNKIDSLSLRALKTTKKPEQKSEFIKAAKRLELFSIAMMIYIILTSEMPFDEALDPDLGDIMPLTDMGFKIIHLRGYSADINYIMTRMLAHEPEKRYTTEEALEAWKNINEKTGKMRTKVYKLS